jgi:prephenate dehydratase
MDFLKKYPNIKLVEDKDTAETARRIRKTTGNSSNCKQNSFKMYDLEIIARNQTIKTT